MAHDVHVVRREVDSDAHVADPRRERTRAQRLDAVDPAERRRRAADRPSASTAGLKRSMWPAWRSTLASRGRRRPVRAPPRRSRRAASRPGQARRARSARERSGGAVSWARRRSSGVELLVGEHVERVGVGARAGLRGGGGASFLASDRRRPPGPRRRRAARFAQVVAAHRPQAGEPDPEPRRPAHRGPARRAPPSPHRSPLPDCRRDRQGVRRRRHLADRHDDRVEVGIGQLRVDRDRQHLVGEPVRHRQVEVGRAGDECLQVRLPVDRHGVVDQRARRRAR